MLTIFPRPVSRMLGSAALVQSHMPQVHIDDPVPLGLVVVPHRLGWYERATGVVDEDVDLP
jgi:hypothetical protein